MLIKSLLFLLLVGLERTSAAPLEGRETLPPPLDDPFYTVPEDIESLPPGAILRHRKPPGGIAAFGVLPVNLEDSHQILYKTTDSFNSSTATVLTVLIPRNANFKKVLSYQPAEDAAFANCAPSYALQLKSASSGLFGTIITQVELLFIIAALEQGWVVIVPDHEGPKGAYLANRLAGHATLDGIRAAFSSSSFTRIDNSARVALLGYSGGSLASQWAAELQPQYAPEIKLAGVAVGGTVPNFTNVITTINKGPVVGIIASGMQGLRQEYKAIDDVLLKHIRPEFVSALDKVRHQCFLPDIADFIFKDVIGMLDDPSVFFTDPVQSILNDVGLGKYTPEAPMYIYKSVNDEISPIADTDAMVKEYCARGVSVEYLRDSASEHGVLAATGAPRALAWLIDVMDGKKPGSGCSTKTAVSSLLDPSTASVLPSFIINALLDLVGKPAGPAHPIIG